MAIYAFQGKCPQIGRETFVHPDATLIGDVTVGANCFIAPGARLRGDWGKIVIGDNCNIQDNCVIHVRPGEQALLGDRCHIAHGSILHGAVLERNVFVGMCCLVMDGAVLKQSCCLAAGTMVLAARIIEADTLAMGSPAKSAGLIPEKLRAELEWAREQYIALPKQYQASLNNIVSCFPHH